jgi:hypothetical protein
VGDVPQDGGVGGVGEGEVGGGEQPGGHGDDE